jgi:hypothetical protein
MKTKMKRVVSQSSARRAPATGTAKKRSRAEQALARRLMALLKSGADTRVGKVKRIRQSVRTRSYENELKLSVALDRMAKDLAI